MDTRPDENGMAPRRRQHFRMLGVFVIPPHGGLKTTSTAGHKCCAVFVLGRRPPWLLLQLRLHLGTKAQHSSLPRFLQPNLPQTEIDQRGRLGTGLYAAAISLAEARSLSMSRTGGAPNRRRYSRLNWEGLS